MKVASLCMLCALIGGVAGALFVVQFQPTARGNPPPSHAEPDEHEADVEPRIAALESTVATAVDELARLRRDVDARVADAPPTGSTGAAPREAVAELVAQAASAAVETAHADRLNARIAARQERDTALVEAFEDAATVSPETSAELEQIYFDVTARHLTLIDEAENGKRAWEEAREEMDVNWKSGQQRVRELLEPEDYELLVSIAKGHSTTLHLPRSDSGTTVDPISG